jgi:hypothetical protein
MGLNVSNAQIAQELDINERTVHDMCDKLGRKVFEDRPAVELSGEVELDEFYVVAGHKGHPAAVKKGKAWSAAAIEGRQRSWHAGEGEYARDDDGDGFCEVHVNTMEGFWSLL